MTPLPPKIRRNGFTYIQILRGQKSCIYAQWYEETLIAYEVFLIKVRPKRQIKDTWIEEKEVFPKDEDFGYSAWTYQTWERAKVRFENLEYNGPRNLRKTK